MTLPASGAITMADVNAELGLQPNILISLNDAAVRTLAGIPSGAISLNDLHGKSSTLVLHYVEVDAVDGNDYTTTLKRDSGNITIGTWDVTMGDYILFTPDITLDKGYYYTIYTTRTCDITVNYNGGNIANGFAMSLQFLAPSGGGPLNIGTMNF